MFTYRLVTFLEFESLTGAHIERTLRLLMLAHKKGVIEDNQLIDMLNIAFDLTDIEFISLENEIFTAKFNKQLYQFLY